jgi:uncharacterized short protein YbdD (DUF466 family)
VRAKMNRTFLQFRRIFEYTAWWFRQVLGDAAYENYLHSASRHLNKSGSGEPFSAEEFYLDALRRRYSGVSRCC